MRKMNVDRLAPAELQGRDIICISTHYWDERRYRKQEFMSRFAKCNRVLYVEPSFSLVRRPAPHRRSVAMNRVIGARVRHAGDNLYVLTPPRGLPKWTDPRIEQLSYRRQARCAARAAARLGFHDAVLWLYNPSYAVALDVVPHRHLVFDLVDDLAAYHGANLRRRAVVERQLGDLVGRSDLLIVTAHTLLERHRPRARRVVQVPNGFDDTLFAPAQAAVVPSALRGITRPILGFVGTIFTLLDFPLMESVARDHSDKSLVLVGPVEPSARPLLTKLCSLPNVFHLPPVAQGDIAGFVGSFDVCLNPFAEGPLADSVSPLKVYEYLALGRPVVSSPMASLAREPAGTVVEFGNGAKDFSMKINRCLGDVSAAAAARRRAVAAGYSWGTLFDRLTRACGEALI
jgi:glycosyltransferase involved in cell wall biosynthesis